LGMNASAQLNLGVVLMLQAGRCLDLAAGVPEEYVAQLEEQAEASISQAALFGEPEAVELVSRRGPLQMVWGFA